MFVIDLGPLASSLAARDKSRADIAELAWEREFRERVGWEAYLEYKDIQRANQRRRERIELKTRELEVRDKEADATRELAAVLKELISRSGDSSDD